MMVPTLTSLIKCCC